MASLLYFFDDISDSFNLAFIIVEEQEEAGVTIVTDYLELSADSLISAQVSNTPLILAYTHHTRLMHHASYI